LHALAARVMTEGVRDPDVRFGGAQRPRSLAAVRLFSARPLVPVHCPASLRNWMH